MTEFTEEHVGKRVHLCTKCLKGFLADPYEKCPNPECGHQAAQEDNSTFTITSISEEPILSVTEHGHDHDWVNEWNKP